LAVFVESPIPIWICFVISITSVPSQYPPGNRKMGKSPEIKHCKIVLRLSIKLTN
jgi:hypothetical protein